MNALLKKSLGYSTPEELFDSFLVRCIIKVRLHSDLIQTTGVQFKITIFK